MARHLTGSVFNMMNSEYPSKDNHLDFYIQLYKDFYIKLYELYQCVNKDQNKMYMPILYQSV